MTDFEGLPRRVFLDSSTLQTMHRYGEFIFENIEPPSTDRIYQVPAGIEDLDSLRAICFVNKRGAIELAISGHSFDEVAAKGDSSYVQWAYDILGYWQGCLAAYGHHSPYSGIGSVRAARLDGPSFGYLSAEDRLLIRDALELECDAFLTMESRLPKNAEHLWRQVQLRILRPSEYRSLF